MRIQQNVCSKMWTDTNIDFRRLNIRHCCKQLGYDITLKEIDQLGVDMFEKYEQNINNRKEMLFEDRLPEACKLCKINGDKAIRHNWNIWHDGYIIENREKLLTADKTWYLEIDLGDQCDLACTYCGPWSSTTWQKELRHDKQAESEHQREWREKTMENMFKRIEQLDPDTAMMINFLGGEPTLMPDTYKILDRLKPILGRFNRKVNLIFTSNLNTKEALFRKFIDTIKDTQDVAYWTIGVSIENTGDRAELVRYGLDWDRFTSNLKELQHHARIAFTCTHNVLSLPWFHETVEWFFENMDTPYQQSGRDIAWMITPNCVYDNVLDPAYLREGDVDFQKIYAVLEKYNVDQDIVDHIKNLEGRVGEKTVTDNLVMKFYIYYRNLFMRDERYAKLFPYITERLKELEPHLPGTVDPKTDFEYIWKRQTNPSDVVYDKDKL